MTTSAQAAICKGGEAPFAIEAVTLDEPRADEVLVRIHACGICHTDMAARDGQLPTPLPMVLGHEGAGVVEKVGSEVTHVKPGDRVLMSFNSCGTCPSCEVDKPTYCYNFVPENWIGTRPDGSHTLHRDGEGVNANFFGQSSFATHAIGHARNVVKVPESAAHVPLSTLAPLGCGFMTGAGAVLRSMKVRAGMPIAVFGTGAVGLGAIMAAKIAGANPIIAVDIHDNRLALARELGATHTINGKTSNAEEEIRKLCPQGLGYAFDTTGLKAIIESAAGLIAPLGIVGIVGASDPAANLTLNESAFMGGGKRLMGILGGDSDLFGFLPELIDHHLAGRFPHDRLIKTFPFAQIDEAFHAGESGAVVKPVLVMDA
ncbi:aryl-alcohol dehydrogenase [Sphingobium sp. B1D7B]|uniref:NAD(P)-dependent alcohol dehydrogenase n=1 Tax=unclassified Sphingobium TaxID=2611147 RepID=UPI002224E510|nr:MULTISPECIES: NAD(P)-dependent alcohol dehydrogenase [unclassified Sphingobium]MCW2388024.1 aryl-alcohol dehydrogenase [Sphingobium sp. B11D3B]MCW2390747.1 aryl-alcohol dehydrogenase [Sphingobium sp. B11D3A]MCW2394556.1 aryl-alcohol dehydrogenase [Sphingobium sp. B8D3B]MCW2405889.1 aryl-alcohol dehydrogenase [Sphingobium sp. B1D7B]MCW2412218.1 aryl-alcohol dehydrogenase [Sphingobium sp. B8D3D]